MNVLQRKEWRIPVKKDNLSKINIITGSINKAAPLEILNISRSGVYVASDDPALKLGKNIDISLEQNGKIITQTIGDIRWINDKKIKGLPAGAGVLLNHQTPEQKDLWNNFIETYIKSLKAKDLMQNNYAFIDELENISKAIIKIKQKNTNTLIVINNDNKPSGVLNSNDILTLFTKKDINNKTLKEICNKPFLIDKNVSAEKAFDIFFANALDHLLVTGTEKIEGIITYRDLVLYWSEFMELKNQRLSSNMQKILGTVAHDFRTPLGIISTSNKLLLLNKLSADEYISSGLPQMIDENCSHLDNLINDMLDITNFKLNEVRLKKEKFNLTLAIKETLKKFRATAIALNIEIKDFNFKNEVNINADKNKLIQVLNNLIGNAIKYGPKGTKISVTLKELTNNVIECSFKDTGPGIPPNEQQNLFTEFYTTSVKPQHGEKSTGLGLYICKKIIEAHNGTITVKSRLGEGSCFIINIPKY